MRSYGYSGACEVPVGKSTSLDYFKIIAYTKTSRTNPMFGGKIEAVTIKAYFWESLYNYAGLFLENGQLWLNKFCIPIF